MAQKKMLLDGTSLNGSVVERPPQLAVSASMRADEMTIRSTRLSISNALVRVFEFIHPSPETEYALESHYVTRKTAGDLDQTKSKSGVNSTRLLAGIKFFSQTVSNEVEGKHR